MLICFLLIDGMEMGKIKMGKTGQDRPDQSEMLHLARWGVQIKKDFIALMRRFEDGKPFRYKHTIDCCDKTYILFTQDSLAEAYGRNMDGVINNTKPIKVVFEGRHEDGQQIEDFTLETLEVYYRVIFHRWPGFKTSAKNLLVKEHITNRMIGFCKYSNFIYQFMIPIDLRKIAMNLSRSIDCYIEVHQDDVYQAKSKGPKKVSNNNVFIFGNQKLKM